MAEYIEREEIRGAYEKLTRSYVNDDPYIADWRFDEMIENLPASDVTPVRHGRWERDEWGSYLRRCSVCKKSPVYKDERRNSVAVYAGVCINCGAKMDDVSDEE